MVAVRGGFDLGNGLFRQATERNERYAGQLKARHVAEKLSVKRALEAAEKSRQEYDWWYDERKKEQFSRKGGAKIVRSLFMRGGSLLSALGCLIVFFAFDLSAASLHSYQDLAASILAGERLTIVLNLQECSKSPALPIGNFSPNATLLVPATEKCKEHISTSHLHFTDYPGHPAYEYTKYTFWPDGAVEIRTTLYDPVDFHEVKRHSITCEIGRGVALISL